MYKLMKESDTPWLDMETGEPVVDSDVVAFGISTEILYTNVLSLIDLMKMELRSKNRSISDPIILAGGGGLGNPIPLMPFVDVFFMGEAEAGLVELMQVLCSDTGKEEKLKKAAGLPGVLVPEFFDGSKIRWNIADSLSKETAPVEQIVPLATVSHDRAVVEIARGCTRGCRFCQASQLSRPVRERPYQDILDLINDSVSCTGWEQAGILSLSFSDYSELSDLLVGFASIEEKKHLRISQPSLRPDTLPGLTNKRFFKGSLTMAPEAGSERLRKVINKPISHSDIIKAAEVASKMGARGIKLYFMIGLPTETEEDLLEIASLADMIASVMGRKRKVTVALSPFVPKPHTPFQWSPQPPQEELWRRIKFVKEHIKKAKVSWNDPRVSVVEYLLCTGDESSQDILEKAFLNGAIFDGWSDLFRWDIWEPLLPEENPVFHVDQELPWQFIDTGVKSDWVKEEYFRSLKAEVLDDCRIIGCTDCGACDGIVPVMPELSDIVSENINKTAPLPVSRIRLRYHKTGLARFASHLDMLRMWTRVLRRTGLPIYYSPGFARRMKLVFSQPIPLGFASESEYLDFQLIDGRNLSDVFKAVNVELPNGFKVVAMQELVGKYRSPGALTEVAEYIIDGVEDMDTLLDYLKENKLVISIEKVSEHSVRMLSDATKREARPDRIMQAAEIEWNMIVRKNIYFVDEKGSYMPLLATV